MDSFQGLQVCLLIFVILFLYCYLGSIFTERFIELERVAYDIDWFMFPLEIQKDLKFIMLVGQKDVFLRGFGGVDCSLEILMKVSKKN